MMPNTRRAQKPIGADVPAPTPTPDDEDEDDDDECAMAGAIKGGEITTRSMRRKTIIKRGVQSLAIVAFAILLAALPGADATFWPFMKYFSAMRAPPRAYAASAPPPAVGASASASSLASEDDGFSIALGDGVRMPIELTPGEPRPFRIVVTNRSGGAANLTFDVVETPGPDGESPRLVRLLGVRPIDGEPSDANPREAIVPAAGANGPGTPLEVALLASAPNTDRRVQTAVTLTARDARGHTAYLEDPLELTVLPGPSSSSLAPKRIPGGEEECASMEEALRGGEDTATFARVWTASGAGSRLPSDNVTVLAPNDAAFAALADTLGVTLPELLESPSLELLALHHVLPRALSPRQIAQLQDARTVTCDAVGVAVRQGKLSVGACELEPLRRAGPPLCEGRVYTLACVLPPPAEATQDPESLCLPAQPPLPEERVESFGGSGGMGEGAGSGAHALTFSLPPSLASSGEGGEGGDEAYDDYTYEYADDFEPPISSQGQGGGGGGGSEFSLPPNFGGAHDAPPPAQAVRPRDGLGREPASPSFPKSAGAGGGGRGGEGGEGREGGPGDAFAWSEGAEGAFVEVPVAVLPQRVPDKWTRLAHLAKSGDAPVKATFLPPGWREWITPGSMQCVVEHGQGLRADPTRAQEGMPREECAAVRVNGRTCREAGMLHACGALSSAGPMSYQVQPPPEAYEGGFLAIGDTYVWQSVEGGSAYCTPATPDGRAFQGAVYHEAWVEAEPGLETKLFLLQNPLDGAPWQMVAMQGAPPPGAHRTRRLKTLGQGCFMWVVASSQGTEGRYRFHLAVQTEHANANTERQHARQHAREAEVYG